jgi:hypothetical protein
VIVIREDIASMLHAGHSQAHIVRTLHVAPRTVQLHRLTLGLPPAKPGPRAPASFEAAYQALAVPAEGGHARWTGPVSSKGVAVVWIRSTARSAARIAFQLRHGREPVGNVKSTCEMEQCVAGSHLEDRPMREANRRADRAFNAIFREAS